MKAFHMMTFLLLVVGGLNWGLEVFGYGIGNFIPAGVAKVIYILVALSALYEIATHKKECRVCSAGAM